MYHTENYIVNFGPTIQVYRTDTPFYPYDYGCWLVRELKQCTIYKTFRLNQRLLWDIIYNTFFSK